MVSIYEGEPYRLVELEHESGNKGSYEECRVLRHTQLSLGIYGGGR
jgi:hypothetical protein